MKTYTKLVTLLNTLYCVKTYLQSHNCTNLTTVINAINFVHKESYRLLEKQYSL